MEMLLRIQKYFLVILALAIAGSCTRQSNQVQVEQSLEEIAREIINNSGNCTLITVGDNGQPRARIMDPFPPQENFIIWFGTNVKSRKVNEIANNNRATVLYFDKTSAAYVSLYGSAEIINEPNLKSKYWKSDWQNFYPNYPKGYCLIKFTPDYLELISEKHGVTGDSATWKPANIIF